MDGSNESLLVCVSQTADGTLCFLWFCRTGVIFSMMEPISYVILFPLLHSDTGYRHPRIAVCTRNEYTSTCCCSRPIFLHRRRHIICWFFFDECLRVVLREVVSASVPFLSSPLFLITGTVDSSHPLALAITTPTPSCRHFLCGVSGSRWCLFFPSSLFQRKHVSVVTRGIELWLPSL